MHSPIDNRRRELRQKVHIPANAILSGRPSGRAHEPGEILDLSENGACIQTSLPLRAESHLTLSLDLLETDSFVATSGVVIWSDQRGRSGIYFDGISDSSRQQIKHWLMSHGGAAGQNQSATSHPHTHPHRDILGPRPVRPLSTQVESKRDIGKHEMTKQSPERTRAAIAGVSGNGGEQSTSADYSSLLSAMVAVKREVEAAGRDLEKILPMLAERALALTHSTGSAIAMSENPGANLMICRARAGSDAPGLGAKLHVESGFSGECVRSNKTLRCDDAESDPRVDREGCRTLGIRSIIATPVRNDSEVIGLMEVFSPARNAFGPADEKILERLAEMIPSTMHAIATELAAAALPSIAIAEVAPKPELRLERIDSPIALGHYLEPAPSPMRRVLLVALGVCVAAALAWLITLGASHKSLQKGSPPSQQNSLAKPQGSISSTTDFEKLRKLADAGDPNAQFDLGARYATGEDVKQDYGESVRWFTMAAEQGHVIAQATLGAYYWAGRGIPQNLEKAYFWSAIAQNGGDEASRFRVTVLASRMPHSQVVTAQQQADDWLKKHKVSGNASP